MDMTEHETRAERWLQPCVLLGGMLLPPLVLGAALVCLYTDRDLMGVCLVVAAAIAFGLSMIGLPIIDGAITGYGTDGVLAAVVMTVVFLPLLAFVRFPLSIAMEQFDPARHMVDEGGVEYFVHHPLGEPFPFLSARPGLRSWIEHTCATGGGLVNGTPVQRYAGTVIAHPATPGGMSVAGCFDNPKPLNQAVLFVRQPDNTTLLLRPRNHAWTRPTRRSGAAAPPGERITVCAVPGVDAHWWPRMGIVNGDPVYAPEPTATYAQVFWLLDLP